MEGLREQVSEVEMLDLVAGVEQNAQVARQSCGIARDVRDMAGFGRG